jgi:hypothetical protein
MRGVLDTTLCDKVCQWLAIGRWFSPGTPVTPTNKTELHDIAEILLKVPLNTINKPTKQPKFKLIILMTQISIGIRRPDVTPRKENTPCVTTIKGNWPVTYNYRLCRGNWPVTYNYRLCRGNSPVTYNYRLCRGNSPVTYNYRLCRGNSPVTYNYRLCRGLLGRKENHSPTFWVEMYWWHRPTQIQQSYNRAHDSPWKCNELISQM